MSFALPTYHFDEHLHLLENLGFVLRVLGRLDEAEAKLKEAMDMASSHPNPLRQVQNMLRLATVYQWQKKFKEADKLFASCKKLLKSSSFSEGLKSSYHQHYGKFLFDQQMYKKAEVEFAKALEIRESIKAPQDQITSSTFALEQTRRRNEAFA